MKRIKVPRGFYARLYSISFWLLRRAYPASVTVLYAPAKGYYHVHTTSWSDDGERIVGKLEAIVE